MPKYKICSSGVSKHMLKRLINPFIFGAIFFLAVFISLYFFEKNYSPLAISLIVLGITGSLYLIFFWLRTREILYNKVKIKVIEACIVETNSVDYGDKIYYPLIKYEYYIDNHKYISSNVCIDDRSCYVTVWYENKKENRGLVFAQHKLDKLLENNYAYCLRILPSVAYLDISLKANRKLYFSGLLFFSLAIVLLGAIWL